MVRRLPPVDQVGPQGRAPAGAVVPVEFLQRSGSSDAGETAESVLKAYPARSGDPLAIAEWLRGKFGGVPGVRISADQRTGQVLVLAAPEIQSQIEQSLNEAPAPAAPRASPQGPASGPSLQPSPASQTPGSQTVQLKHNTAQQMEMALAATLGNRLVSGRSAGFGLTSYGVTLPGGETVELIVDHQNNRITVQGTGTAVGSCVRLVQALEAVRAPGDQSTQLVPLKTSKAADIRRAIEAIEAGNTTNGKRTADASEATKQPGAMLALMFQQSPEAPANRTPATPSAAVPPAPPIRAGAPTPPRAGAGSAPAPARPGQAPVAGIGGLVGPVQIEMIQDLGLLILRGRQRDVEQAMQIIQQIEKLSTETEPVIEVYFLEHVDSETMAQLIGQIYLDVYYARQGNVSITALVKPNALLVVGRRENVRTAIDLTKRLDQPVAPETQFRVFQLRHATAAAAQLTVQEFFANRGGLGTRARVTADYRSNSLIVQASGRDLAEVAELIARIDTTTSEAVHELRVFPLENSLAYELAQTLQFAISGQGAARAPTIPGVPGVPGAAAVTGQKSTMLRFLMVDPKGQRFVNSGILTDVVISADMRTNSLLVSAPADCMELIEALIHQLDTRPAAEALIKVFTIVNADALSLVNMLNSLFAQPTAPGQLLLQTAAAQGESTLITLRFAVDMRTNSIIASGSKGDLSVVEAILLRLDDAEVRARKSSIYRLKNAPAADVSTAINSFLRSEQQIRQISPGLLSPFEQIEREVIVVAEPVSNSLIVSATPRFYDEIQSLIEQIDKRPSMVMIQVLIAEVKLNNTDEFGVELGLQDGLLFDRSILGNILSTTQTTYNTVGNPVSQNQTVIAATNTPGFTFNNFPLGNSGSAQSLTGSNAVGTQGLTNFSVGRTNETLGYGGFVFSASSENVSVLIRALRECRRLDVLSRPQVMTLDNQAAFIQVGQRVPRITGTSVSTVGGQVNTITLENVGLILGVTPRVCPDGLVVMMIDAEKSALGPEAEGIPVSVSPTGQVIRSPRIDTTTAQTTVSALSGQTVVLGGLITKDKSSISRRVPLLSDIPVLGNLFRYDGTIVGRNELLIIMTPHIVQSEEDAEAIKQVEAARMNWCLADVYQLAGDIGLRARGDQWSDAETTVIYPDRTPGAKQPPAPTGKPSGAELVPTPSGAPPSTRTPAQPPGPGSGRMPVTPPGAGPPEARQEPAGSQLRLRPADGVPYVPPVQSGAAQASYYQSSNAPAAQGYPDPRWPAAAYNGPPQQQPAPVHELPPRPVQQNP